MVAISKILIFRNHNRRQKKSEKKQTLPGIPTKIIKRRSAHNARKSIYIYSIIYTILHFSTISFKRVTLLFLYFIKFSFNFRGNKKCLIQTKLRLQ